MSASYTTSETRRVDAANGTSFAYRDLGEGDVPVVLFQHFRGNLENWDAALIDALAASRRVLTFDNTGVGATSGMTPHTIAEMAQDAIAFNTVATAWPDVVQAARSPQTGTGEQATFDFEED